MSSPFPNQPLCTTADLPAAATDELQATVGADTIATGLQLASTILYNLTGQRWPGPKETTVWPRGPRVIDPVRSAEIGHAASELDLDYWPILSITEVRINGLVIDPSHYRIDDGGRYIVWMPSDPPQAGERLTWPAAQYLSRADGSQGTWSLTILWGEEQPAEARSVAGMLGWQYALALAQNPACGLSPQTQSQTRRGSSTRVNDPTVLAKNGQVGFKPVDDWVAALGKGKSSRRASILRPGSGRNTRRRGTPPGS